MTLASDIGAMLDPVINAFTGQLRTSLDGHAVTAYLSGSSQMVEWGRTKLTDRPIFHEGPPMPQATRYARRRGAQMVTRMNAETKERLARVISDGIQNKRGIPGLQADIRREFSDMSTKRARVIARTETADALEESFLERGKAMGVTGKRWVTVGDSEVSDACRANQGEGDVAFDHVFSSGDTRPPQHPNCRCALAPVMLETQ